MVLIRRKIFRRTQSAQKTRNIFPSFITKKLGEIICSTFVAKTSILAYILLKTTKMGQIGNYDVIVTSYTEYLNFFGMYGKKRPIAHSYTMVPNKHTSSVYFSVHRGWNNLPPPPPVSRVPKEKQEKVYFKSQILVHEYWTIPDHFYAPVLKASE